MSCFEFDSSPTQRKKKLYIVLQPQQTRSRYVGLYDHQSFHACMHETACCAAWCKYSVEVVKLPRTKNRGKIMHRCHCKKNIQTLLHYYQMKIFAKKPATSKDIALCTSKNYVSGKVMML